MQASSDARILHFQLVKDNSCFWFYFQNAPYKNLLIENFITEKWVLVINLYPNNKGKLLI